MYAPSLRLERAELKCRSGCDYFGNPQWDGYCSKCHREQVQRRRDVKPPPLRPTAAATAAAAASAFSKFEEKRLRQTDSLKKTNILKFNVFRKSSNAEDMDRPSTHPRDTIAVGASEALRRSIARRFPTLSDSAAERELRRATMHVLHDMQAAVRQMPALSADELSERIQCHYQKLERRMDNAPAFAAIDSEIRERLVDLFEKHVMVCLHGHVFSWGGEEEERADRALHARISRLSWLRPAHLDCGLQQPGTRRAAQLLHDAVAELIAVDAAPAPQGKLGRVRRCCACVAALASEARGAPASADDLLPALIFTVLRANPPRLASNVNYVTRFCNANRLMTGERGYYFTNLCCAVAFIERVDAAALGMPPETFQAYMRMPPAIGGNCWAASLSLCSHAREAEALRRAASELRARAETAPAAAEARIASSQLFHEEISKKIDSVLQRTPLLVEPRAPRLRYLLAPPGQGPLPSSLSNSAIDSSIVNSPQLDPTAVPLAAVDLSPPASPSQIIADEFDSSPLEQDDPAVVASQAPESTTVPSSSESTVEFRASPPPQAMVSHIQTSNFSASQELVSQSQTLDVPTLQELGSPRSEDSVSLSQTLNLSLPQDLVPQPQTLVTQSQTLDVPTSQESNSIPLEYSVSQSRPLNFSLSQDLVSQPHALVARPHTLTSPTQVLISTPQSVVGPTAPQTVVSSSSSSMSSPPTLADVTYDMTLLDVSTSLLDDDASGDSPMLPVPLVPAPPR